MSAVASPLRPFGRKEPPKPLPDPKVSYERPLKRELSNRLFAITVTYFGFEYAVLLLTSASLGNGVPLGLVGHTIAAALVGGISLLLGGLPPLFLRGRAVSGMLSLYIFPGCYQISILEKHNPSSSRGGIFLSHFSNRQTWRSLAVFAGSGFFLTILYVSWLKLAGWEDSKLLILAPTRYVLALHINNQLANLLT